MTLEFLDEKALWPTLQRLSRTTPGARYIATAYLGPGSHARFPLRANDVLLTSLSIRTAAAGQVCPGDLKAYRKDGVKIFRRDTLHAKVFFYGDRAIVGSPNVSSHSGRLDEAALLTDNPGVLKRIRAWFAARCTQEVSDHFLAVCAKAWRPPAFTPAAPGGHRNGRLGRSDAEGERTYLLSLDMDLAEQDAAYDRVESRLLAGAKATRAPQTHGERTWFFWYGSGGGIGREIRPGDTVIPVWFANGKRRVLPYYTVLAAEPSETAKGKELRIIYVATPGDTPSIGWSRFRNLAAKRGVILGDRFRSRQIRDPRDAAALRGLASGRSAGTA